MEIIIGADHGGFELKEKIKVMLEETLVVHDLGTYTKDSVDYPDYAEKVCEMVLATDNSLGILICGTGIGISMAANKIKGIRAALCNNEFMAKMGRMHNNANVLALGERVLGDELSKEIVKTFISTEFEGGRHERRVDKISLIEEA